MKNFVTATLILGVVLLSGCVERTITSHPSSTITGPILTCPAGTECRTGGQSGVRVTINDYGGVRGQAVIEEWSQWGYERPPFVYESTRRPHGYRRSLYDGLNELQRRERRFGTENSCYTYRKPNGEPACL